MSSIGSNYIKRLLSNDQGEERGLRFHNNEIKLSDIRLLTENKKLNDNVINYYMELLSSAVNAAGQLKVYCFSTFFFTGLRERGMISSSRWTRKLNIADFNLVLFPLHLDTHWALCVLDNRTNTLRYYDSLDHFTGRVPLSLISKFLKGELKDVGENLSTETVKNLPCQMNRIDCGVFLLMNARAVSCDLFPREVDQGLVDLTRHLFVYEILQSRLIL